MTSQLIALRCTIDRMAREGSTLAHQPLLTSVSRARPLAPLVALMVSSWVLFISWVRVPMTADE